MGTALPAQYKSRSNVLSIRTQHCALFFSFIWSSKKKKKTAEEYMTNGESKAMPFIISIGALLICWYEIQKIGWRPSRDKTNLDLRSTKTPLCVCLKRWRRNTEFTCAEYKRSGTTAYFPRQRAKFPRNGRDAELAHRGGGGWPVISGADRRYFPSVLPRDQMRSHRNDCGCCVGDLLNSLEKLRRKAVCLDFNEEF